MELFLLILQAPLLVILIKWMGKWHSDPLHKKVYYFLVSFKVTAGFIFGLVYFNYYKGGDTVDYYKELIAFSELFYNNSEAYFRLLFFDERNEGLNQLLKYEAQPRAFLFLKIVSPLFIFTGNNYWILSIYLSLFSFAGLWKLSTTLISIFKMNSLAVMISFFVFPSVVFWSTGLSKESLIIGVLGFWLVLLLEGVHATKISFVRGAFFVLCSLLLLYIKFYYFAVLAAVFIPYGVVFLFSKKYETLAENIYIKGFSFFFLLMVMAGVATLLHPQLYIQVLFDRIYLNYTSTLRISNFQNTFVFEGLSSSPISFIRHIPEALANGLFGPFLWNCRKLISLMSGIENTILVALFITYSIQLFQKKFWKSFGLFEFSMLLYCVVLAILLAFSSPNWGSLVRYKVGFLPFFVLVLLNRNKIIFSWEKRLNAFLKLEAN